MALECIDDYAIQGIVKWSYLHHGDDKTRYRMGIEVGRIILHDDMEICFPESAALMKKIRLEADKNRRVAGSGSSSSPDA